MATIYEENGELTDACQFSLDLVKKCTISVGTTQEVKVNKKGDDANTSNSKVKYWQKYVQIQYPGTGKKGFIFPGCVVHCDTFDYFGKPSAYVGVPVSFCKSMEPNINAQDIKVLWEDKKVSSDATWWWSRVSLPPAAEGKEYIRICDGEEDEFYNSFTHLFGVYPTSVKANILCNVRLTTETDGPPPTAMSVWRAALAINMITAYDSMDIPSPKTITQQSSIPGKKDMVKQGLLKFKKGGNPNASKNVNGDSTSNGIPKK